MTETPEPCDARSEGASDPSHLTLLVRGQGQFGPDFAVDSPSGFALWFEGSQSRVELAGQRRAQVETTFGTPYLAILNLGPAGGEESLLHRELFVPCVDVVGLAVLGDGLEDYQDMLAHERKNRSVH